MSLVCLLPKLNSAQTAPAPSNGTLPVKWTAVITAHPDDWQLFMGGTVCDVMQKQRRTVFICLTGGQANEAADAYWQSREAGHWASVRQAVALSANPTGSTPPSFTTETVTVNGHAIEAHRYQNAVAFYLRLPDGGVAGKGLARCNMQSLKKLKEQGQPLTPLTGGAPYQTWKELLQTAQALLAHETNGGQLTIHTAQPDERLNPGDHSDHRMAGLVALGAMEQMECRFLQYVGYDVAQRPANLTPTQQSNQLRVYKAYSQTMSSRGQEDGWDDKHLRFLGHQYCQVKHQTGSVLQPSRPAVADSTTGKGEDDILASRLVLEPNYPNPFSVSSLLVYDLPIPAAVWLRVLDMQGREVLRLQNGGVQTVGRHEQWLDVQRFPATGAYIAELRVGKQRRLCRLQVAR